MSDSVPPAASNQPADVEPPSNAAPPEPRNVRSRSRLATRLVVWGMVLVLAAVVLLDVRARRAAQATADAWGAALNDHTLVDGKEFELRPAQLGDYIVGTPAVRPAPDAEVVKYDEGSTVQDYVWSGPFREHVVRVVSSRGEHAIVEQVEIPGSDE